MQTSKLEMWERRKKEGKREAEAPSETSGDNAGFISLVLFTDHLLSPQALQIRLILTVISIVVSKKRMWAGKDFLSKWSCSLNTKC
jgi:hypothetical protein